MSYRRAILRRWSRRDLLAVLVIAASVAFLTGATVVGHAATTELAGVAEDFESPAAVTAYDDPTAARASAGDADVVVPLADAERADGTAVTVAGIPADGDGVAPDSEFALPQQPPAETLRGPVDAPRQVDFVGTEGRVSAEVAPPSADSSLPGRWYVATPSTVDRLGPTGALVMSPDEGATPVVGVLSFFVAGSRQVLRSLGVATAAAGVLVGVTVFATTRMTVRDRVRVVRVARATGATPRDVLTLFAARAGLQAAVGVSAGYAVGVIAPNAAVNGAVFVGEPTSLSMRVTGPVAEILGPSYVAVVAAGVLGGALAALPAVRRPPARLTGRAERTGAGSSSRFPSWLEPTVLDWRAVVPTGTTLAVFLLVAVLVASGSSVVAPLASGNGATITEPGASHPFASDLPERHASELRARGVAASPEILALGVTGGHPYVARGAAFERFANVTDATVADGRAPNAPGEAVVGADLARTLGVGVGDPLVVGGSTRAAVDRLRVVGTYRAPEPYDDQLVVPLDTARALSGKGHDRVQFVRTAERLEPTGSAGLTITGVALPSTVLADEPLEVSVTVANPTDEPRSRTVRADFDGGTETASVDLAPGERRTVAFEFPAGSPRETAATVDGRAYPVTVVDPDALGVVGLPETAPPDSQPRVRVVTASGTPVQGATVSVDGPTAPSDGPAATPDGRSGTADGQSLTTGGSGWVRIPLGEPGSYTVTAVEGERTADATVTVRRGAVRRPTASVAVSPDRPTAATIPDAQVSLRNPWNRTLAVPLRIAGPGSVARESVDLPPGERRNVTVPLARQPPGEYEVTVSSDGTRLSTATYEVGGDPRLAAAMATGGRDGATTALGEALSIVLGNLRLVVGTLLGLAALMTVGGTTAAFASAVHARRRTLGVHRATGATPGQVLGLVLRDAARIGVVATALGLALAGVVLVALDATGLLVVYGVRALSAVDPAVIVGSAAAALALALLGAALATVGLVRRSPSSLLVDERSAAGRGRGRSAADRGGESGG